MDTMIERKPGMKRKHYYAIAGAVALVGLIFYFQGHFLFYECRKRPADHCYCYPRRVQ